MPPLNTLPCRNGRRRFFPEVVNTDRADHHLLADHVARRAVRCSQLVGWVERSETHHPACQRSPKLRVSLPLSPAQSAGYAPSRTIFANDECGQSFTRCTSPCLTGLNWI